MKEIWTKVIGNYVQEVLYSNNIDKKLQTRLSLLKWSAQYITLKTLSSTDLFTIEICITCPLCCFSCIVELFFVWEFLSLCKNNSWQKSFHVKLEWIYLRIWNLCFPLNCIVHLQLKWKLERLCYSISYDTWT